MKAEVKEKFESYPSHIKPLVLQLRELVFSVAEDWQLGEINEFLKWGEPSYQVKNGSPIRMDWKPKFPNQYFLFFHCQTKLVDTFRELYSEVLEFEGNRAIVLHTNSDLPIKAIRHCIEMAMRYKNIRHLPLLGA
ncbi:DUF1801 domain-containing protein [Sedimenticola sp.]|uniref:DUF1801 domain-containing protein n=1 Tax=Sedimenticola sp. TaxID=1940285 RepID=UPI003D14E632